MTIDKPRSLRKCIDENCRNCIYDEQAKGTWRQQVTLCSVTSCAIYPVRPVTKSPIPQSVLKYYSVPEAEYPKYGCSRPPEGCFTEHSDSDEYPAEGWPKSAIEKDPNRGDTR